MMFQMNELLGEVVREAKQKKRSPDQKKFRAQKVIAEKELLDTGYDKRYPKLFDDVASYAALWRMGFASTGYMLMGGTGCGKTEAVKRLSAMLRIEFVTTGELMEAFGTPDYYRMIRQPDFFSGKPQALIIDEIGTEPRPLIHFGTKYNVIADVLRERYDAFKLNDAQSGFNFVSSLHDEFDVGNYESLKAAKNHVLGMIEQYKASPDRVIFG